MVPTVACSSDFVSLFLDILIWHHHKKNLHSKTSYHTSSEYMRKFPKWFIQIEYTFFIYWKKNIPLTEVINKTFHFIRFDKHWSLFYTNWNVPLHTWSYRRRVFLFYNYLWFASVLVKWIINKIGWHWI